MPSRSQTVLVLGRVEVDVVDVLGFFDAHAPAGQAAHDLLVGHVDQQRGGELAPEALELVVERLRLRARAREAVEDEAVGGVRVRRGAR